MLLLIMKEILKAGTLGVPTPQTADLGWLMQRASERIGGEIREMAQSLGIADHRHWLVLSFIADQAPQNQLELAQSIGMDKTTLMAVLDRLERDGFVVRTFSPADRRVRIPQLTETGRSVCETIRVRRDEIVSRRLANVPTAEQERLRALLWQICDMPTATVG